MLTLQSELRDTPDWDALVHAIEAGDDNGVDALLTEKISIDSFEATSLASMHETIENAIGDAAHDRVKAVIARDCPDVEVDHLSVSVVGQIIVGLGGGKLAIGWNVRVRCGVRQLVA